MKFSKHQMDQAKRILGSLNMEVEVLEDDTILKVEDYYIEYGEVTERVPTLDGEVDRTYNGFIVSAEVHQPATREEPESWDAVVVSRHRSIAEALKAVYLGIHAQRFNIAVENDYWAHFNEENEHV